MKSVWLTLWLVCCAQNVACRAAPFPANSSGSPSPQAAAQDKGERREQTQFGAEERIERPVNLTEGVLQALRKDERNQQRLGQKTSKEITASWFAASEINLNYDDQPDLLVQAVDYRLLGANLVPFWIFRGTKSGYKLLLRLDTLGLQLMNTKTSGYRNLIARQATASHIRVATFEFDGHMYREQHSSTQPIKR